MICPGLRFLPVYSRFGLKVNFIKKKILDFRVDLFLDGNG